MNVNWVFASAWQPAPDLDIENLYNTGPSWGSWKTWRLCRTHNVICHDLAQARSLVERQFQTKCNLYVPQAHYNLLQRPANVKLYQGDYQQVVNDIEDIVALHLATVNADIVLITGFDVGPRTEFDNAADKSKWKNQTGLVFGAIKSAANVQFVLVDHPAELHSNFSQLSNITCDKLKNVLNLLN
jgi:hypothetical protein